MTPSPALIDFLAGWEGPPSLKPRPDPCVAGVWDIGFGHVCSPGHANITHDDAIALLRKDAEQYAAHVGRAVTVALKQHQFDALTSFTFNLGNGALLRSTLLRLVNGNDFDGAAAEFAKWNKAGGKVVAGLVKRRAAEQAMWSLADYSRRP